MPCLNKDRHKCGRTACKRKIAQDDSKDGLVRIWNEPSYVNGFKDYCSDCGHRIIEANQQMYTSEQTDVLFKWRYLVPSAWVIPKSEIEPDDVWVCPRTPLFMRKPQEVFDTGPKIDPKDWEIAMVKHRGRCVEIELRSGMVLRVDSNDGYCSFSFSNLGGDEVAVTKATNVREAKRWQILHPMTNSFNVIRTTEEDSL